MNFFDHQDRARRNTGRLVLLFTLAVIGTIIATYFVVVASMFGFQSYMDGGGTGGIAGGGTQQPIMLDTLLRWDLLGYIGLGVLALVGGGSLYKTAQLSGGGGQTIAMQLGGRAISPDTTDLVERRVLNVVEEMAIASGTPVPPVFIMENEPGINAFAAGYSPGDAVIGITRGCAEKLTRDQLQGVVAHEFSHILNGDMRLNIRLIAVLHGILLIGIVGYYILRSAMYSGHYGRSSRDRGNPLPLLMLGAGLAVVGFIGTLFGNMIKAAVSRQREFLADASAVQFTRNPDGLGGALKAIAGHSQGSKVRSPAAPQASHMFFGLAVSSLFSTHPPIDERIRRIDPRLLTADIPQGGAAARAAGERSDQVMGLAGPSPSGRGRSDASALIDQAGQPTQAHVAQAHDLLEHLPTPIIKAAREPFGARAVIYALLLDRDPQMRGKQLAGLQAAADDGTVRELRRLIPEVDRLDTRARLPVIDLAIGTLRGLSPRQYEAFAAAVRGLVEADAKLSVFEWVLQRIVIDHLDAHFGRAAGPGGRKRPTVKYIALGPVRQHISVLLSALAYAGGRTPDQAAGAMDAARRHIPEELATLVPVEECGLDRLDAAVEKLSGLSPQLKRKLLTAAAAAITADRQITPGEAELIRAFADALGVPLPPLLAGQAMT